MAGERSVAGVLAGAGSGAGTPGLLGLLRAAGLLEFGSSLFLQAHLVLGYALGPAARELLEQARLPVLAAAAIVLAATATLLLRRRRPRVTRVLAEGACPACLALGLVRGGET